MTDSTMPEKTYTDAALTAAVTSSAEDVLDAIGAGDTGVRDVVNLLLNTLNMRLDRPDATLQDVAATYGDDVDLDTILDWCSEAVS